MRDSDRVTMETKLITLIGDPLRQSFAARMQNTAYEAMGCNLLYTYTETDSTHLGEILNGIRYMPSFAGCAVTKPNKVKAMEYLDEADPLCRKMGACNTILRTPDNRLIGYNTDGLGFHRAIREETDLELQDILCFCMGAGGAGRAICASLANAGARKLYISDVAERAAAELAKDIAENFSVAAEAVPFGDFTNVSECGLLVNATGIGMGKTLGQTPIPKECIQGKSYCFDACYNPEKTRFLLDAEELGCQTKNGLGMSLYQGVAQIEIWTGQKAPVEVMRRELQEIIRERQ